MEAPPSNERITRSTKLALRLRFLQQAPRLPHTVWIVDTGDTGGRVAEPFSPTGLLAVLPLRSRALAKAPP